MKSGYLYVLEHPSDPNLVKVGRTYRTPERRLSEHNNDPSRVAGRIVQETGQKWALKQSIAVPDPVLAEAVFWQEVCPAPFRGKEEVAHLPWDRVQRALESASRAGVRGPKRVPDWVYAYTAWMKKRLVGRGITLIGQVRSKYGRSDFRCSNGHQWRTMPNAVAGGQGCPTCGMGEMDAEEISQTFKTYALCLLIHPDKPGFIRIELYDESEDPAPDDELAGWETHRFRRVEEPELALSLIWELLDRPPPPDREPIEIDLKVAEQAFRELVSLIYQEMAASEKTEDGEPSSREAHSPNTMRPPA